VLERLNNVVTGMIRSEDYVRFTQRIGSTPAPRTLGEMADLLSRKKNSSATSSARPAFNPSSAAPRTSNRRRPPSIRFDARFLRRGHPLAGIVLKFCRQFLGGDELAVRSLLLECRENISDARSFATRRTSVPPPRGALLPVPSGCAWSGVEAGQGIRYGWPVRD